jgi:transposase
VVRDQEFLLPPNMADWLAEDHLVWFVIDVVDRLDTGGFHAARRTGGKGRRGYDPDMLLALLVYAYAVGERSSRRIERLCATDVAFRVCCGQDAPDHSTIARFRAEHHDGFADLFAQVLRLCRAEGMVRVGVVSIDGTKIAANAARAANRSPDWVRQQAQRIAAEVLAEADAVDAAEDAAAAERGSDDDLPPGFATRRGRAANIKRALEEIDRQDAEHAESDAADRARAEEYLVRVEAGEVIPGAPPAGVDQVRLRRARLAREQRRAADPTATVGQRMEARRQVRRNEQALARAEEQAAAGQADLRGTTRRDRDRRERRARARGGTGRSVNITDPDSRLMTEGAGGGSVQGYNAQVAVTDDHLILGVHVSQDANDTHCYLPTLAQATRHAQLLGTDIGLVLADAGYFTENNLNAPGPDRLIAPGKNLEIQLDGRQHPTSGPPPPGASPSDAMRHRLRNPANADSYRRRGATVEPVIGHLNDHLGLRRVTRRGVQAVTAELNLAATVINLIRLHNTRPATG